MPWWRWMAASSALFFLVEVVLIKRIEAELIDPAYDDSAGAAFTGLFFILPAIIFLSCITIRLYIYTIKKLVKHLKAL